MVGARVFSFQVKITRAVVQLPIGPIEKTRTFLRVDLAFSSKTLGSGGVHFAHGRAVSIAPCRLRRERELRGHAGFLASQQNVRIAEFARRDDSLKVPICTSWNRGLNPLLSICAMFSRGRFDLFTVRVGTFDAQ